MRFASLLAGVFLGSVILAGCSPGAAEDAFTQPGDTDETTTSVDAQLWFEADSSIDLVPGEDRELTLVAAPAAKYDVYFALRDAPSDASLDASHLVTGADGRATIKLHAPSSPASFTLRAWIADGPITELPVTVTKQGVGSIEVVPEYGGVRAVNEWVASAVVGATCESLAGQLPGEPEGALVATSPEAEYPVVQSVPVGPKVAVAVRAGHFAWGCADAHDIGAAATTKVKVHVVDVAPALDRTALDIGLTYTPEAAAYGALLTSARKAFQSAFFPPGQSESTTLLDAMEAASDDPAAFSLARYTLAWDDVAGVHLAQLSSPLATRMSDWITLGLASATPSLTGQLVALEGVPGSALFYATEIAGADADAAGAPLVHLMTWQAEPGDKVQLSGTVFWLPSRLVGAACKAGSALELGALDSMPDALAKAAGCTDLAATLGPIDACSTECLATLCRDALATRWDAALDASAETGTVGTVDVNATGLLKVDDTATPIALTGTWLGTVSDGAVSAAVTGDVSGVLSQPDEPPPPSGPEGDSPQ